MAAVSNKIDIKEYSYILAVVENGSISKAARKLYISQPSLTVYIQNLESRLGFKFFLEGKGRSELTPEGKLYIRYAKEIVRLNNDLQSQLELIQSHKTGKIRLGIARTRATMFLSTFLSKLKERYPAVDIDIMEGSSRQLEAALENGSIDLALMNESSYMNGLDIIRIGAEEVVLVAPKQMGMLKKAKVVPASRYPWIDMKYMDGKDFILLKPGHRMREVAEEVFKKHGIRPNIVFETESATIAYDLTRLGYGGTFITDVYCDSFPADMDVFSIGDPCITWNLVIGCKKSYTLSKAEQLMLEVIKEVFVPG